MANQLHILTRLNDPLTSEIIARQRQESGTNVTVVDLTLDEPDYQELLEKIFTADSVAVW